MFSDLTEKFMWFENENNFLSGTSSSGGRTIRGSLLIGSQKDLKAVLPSLRVDMRGSDLSLYVKEIQAVDTSGGIYLTFLPASMSDESYQSASV